ncbi:MAG: sulfite exporter TauE/SafE family protein [Methanoregulaceae archaeon]
MDTLLLTLIVLPVAGACIGVLSGLFGVGGGFLMVPVQYFLLTHFGFDQTIALRVAFGTSLAVILPTAISGAYGHHCRKCIAWEAILPMGITGILGAFLGGTVASHAPGALLSLLFGAVLMVAAWRMVAQIQSSGECGSPGVSVPWYLVAGFSVGFFSGLLGIGGGVLMVPIFLLFMRFGVRESIGTSTVLIAIYAVGGFLAYIVNGLGVSGLPEFSLGYVDLLFVVLLAVPSIPLAQVGVRIAHSTSPVRLKQAFSVILIVMGLKMIGVFSVLGIPILS